MPPPFEMVSGPLDVFVAPIATLHPRIDQDPEDWIDLTGSKPWMRLGTNKSKSISDDGLTAGFNETVEGQRTLGSTGIAKQFRTQEDLSFSLTLLDLSTETFAVAMSRFKDVSENGVHIVAKGTAGADKDAEAKFVADFTQPNVSVPTVSAPAATGNTATITSITVNDDGEITDITWASGGTAYATGETITITQVKKINGGGYGFDDSDLNVTATYVLEAGDHSSGVLQNLTGKAIAGTIPTPGYKYVEMFRGFEVLNLAFLMRGFSPYDDGLAAQFWLPQGYASFSGDVGYTKGAAAGIPMSIMAIEHVGRVVNGVRQPSYGHGYYIGQHEAATNS